jgi:hypothetical protein
LQETNLSVSELDAGRNVHESSTAPPSTCAQLVANVQAARRPI